MNPQGANQNRGYPGWDLGNAGASGAGASGQMSLAKGGLASLGRGEDKMLVHMTPGEVRGLQQLALAHGGSLTINPHTGLLEAGFLRNILPAIAAAAAIYFTAGAAAPAVAGTAGAAGAAGAGAAGGLAGMAGGLYSTLGAQGVGALAGGVTGALTNKENPLMGAVMGGLGGYTMGGGMGAGIESGAISPFSYGAEAAGTAGASTGTGLIPTTGSSLGFQARHAGSNALLNPELIPSMGTSAAQTAPNSYALLSPQITGASATGYGVPALGTGAPSSLRLTPASNAATMLGSKSTPTFMQALGQQFPSNTSKLAGAAGIAGTLGAFDTPEPPEMPQEPRSTARLSGPVRRPYDPERNLFTDYGTLQPTYAAKGGEMHSVPQLEDGGFVLTKKAVDGMGGQREAAAGLGAIPIRGPGTGTSDSIPTTIDGVRPAKVSNGEAYVPRKRVKQAGGAKRLYALMRRAEQDAKRRSA